MLYGYIFWNAAKNAHCTIISRRKCSHHFDIPEKKIMDSNENIYHTFGSTPFFSAR